MTATKGLVNLSTFPLKFRNSAIDRLFYDVNSLSLEEQFNLSPFKDHEGTVLLVYPSKSKKGIDHFRNAFQLVTKKRNDIGGIAIAGVGSSVLGTAALARNVADAIDAPVAGIVSGYGMSDLTAEAIGGWVFFGTIDRGKHKAETLMSLLAHGGAMGIATADGFGKGMEEYNALLDGLPLQSDTSALFDLLEADLPKLEWLVGHSKGCLLIDYVLERYVRTRTTPPGALYDRLHVVTLGAVVDLRAPFKKVTQMIGSIDGLGKLNSSLAAPHHVVPGASHHLNRTLAGHMSVVKVFADIQAGRLGPENAIPGWYQPDVPLPDIL